MFLLNKKIKQPAGIEVKESNIHGRGVFAKNKIWKGSLVEQAPVVFLNEAARQCLRCTQLFNYYFLIQHEKTPAAFAFGYASFYNHAAEANAFYSFSKKRNTISIYAFTSIEPGTEITINYNGHPRNKQTVYFPVDNTA